MPVEKNAELCNFIRIEQRKKGTRMGRVYQCLCVWGGGVEMRESSGGEPVYCSGTSRRCMGTKRQGGYRVG